MKVRVDGQWTFNGSGPILRAAPAGAGLAYLSESMLGDHVQAGRLERVLLEWCDVFEGY